MQVVIDTNVFVNGMLFEETEERAVLRLIKKNQADLLVTVPIVDEITTVFHRLLSELDIDSLKPSLELNRALAAARLITPERVIRMVVDDPEDDKFITCAYFGEADYIITEDDHLLDLGGRVKTRRNQSVKVIRPRDFGLEVLRRKQGKGKAHA